MTAPTSETIYTALSFAPVQGFIEKSRKLRDLYGASQILSHLSSTLVNYAQSSKFEVLSPGLLNMKEGMPNRILLMGDRALNRDEVKNTLTTEWGKILDRCRIWVERRLEYDYKWSKTEDDRKGEWERWKSYAWEVFWGYGTTVKDAMEDLETRKLKRDWIGINWTGESSSLSGSDAIAWYGLGQKNDRPWEWSQHKPAVDQFYEDLAKALQEDTLEDNLLGKFLNPNERLSIPELVKRLVTRYEDIGRHLGKEFYFDSLSEMVRMPQPGQSGHWTGWFMGDGDSVGNHLKQLASDSNNIQPLKDFSEAMRTWGKNFKKQFPKDLGRVVYAGGDDFLGVIYSTKQEQPISKQKALNWLMGLNQKWQEHKQDITVSVGFVWAGHSVPQRDVLQNCREAEKRAKELGKNRVTIRVLFNSGQYVQWTCPWDYLDILTKYRDREGQTGSKANWGHIYNDWETLKSRHAIDLDDRKQSFVPTEVAEALFTLYFKPYFKEKKIELQELWGDLIPTNSKTAQMNWINDLIQVGWQLCRNSEA